MEKRLFEKLQDLKESIKTILEENTLMESQLAIKEDEIQSLTRELNSRIELIKETRTKLEALLAENTRLKSSLKKK